MQKKYAQAKYVLRCDRRCYACVRDDCDVPDEIIVDSILPPGRVKYDIGRELSSVRRYDKKRTAV